MKRLLVFIIMAVLSLSLGLTGCDLGAFASAGKIELVAAGKQYAPLKNFVNSRKRDGLYADGRKKQPQEVADELEAISVSDDDVRIEISGKTASSCYTLYDDHNQKVYDSQEKFAMPEKPGRYLLCVSVKWGTQDVYEGMEYFFMIEKQ